MKEKKKRVKVVCTICGKKAIFSATGHYPTCEHTRDKLVGYGGQQK